ncbi:MAG: hypothetical protein A3I13_04005 [Gammaproteobacteria bacterium RIFCSPLOWO2_02_FULL_47_50]|nr:MAG: hypothetical protein A3I13_04005 [Gammaproteobacteria bacterium RIFCSPLOWO2_02_FULL_47_50]
MPDDAGPDHIQVDIDQALKQVLIGSYGGGMITIFPVGAFAPLPLIKFLSSPAGNQLQALWNDGLARVLNQEMNMIRSHYVIQYTQATPFPGFK